MATELNIRADTLGAKLRHARTIHRLTQEVAATKLDLARTTLVAIEAGKRPVSSQELRQFSELYDISESELLNEREAHIELGVHFRSSPTAKQADDEVLVANMLNRLANSTLQIEALLGQAPRNVDLPTVDVPKTGSLERHAEDAALNLRSRFGIGMGPIQNLWALMEFEMGLRVFERPLPSRISGAVAFDAKVGGFVLLNSLHPLPRRRVTGVHEAGHIVTRTTGISVHFDGQPSSDRTERFCDLLGIAFLTPAAALRRKAKELKEMSGEFSVRQLLMLAVFFGVSIEAITRRMETLEMLPLGTFESLRTQKVGLEHRRRVAEEMSVIEEGRPFTPRALMLASIAHERELLSEQQIASMLELNLVDVRQALEEHQGDGEMVLELAE
ncbi:helix-turn-helix domain-containing protein [Polaromonas sp. JS666]|uniref:helix-turn-helix domain-containing protein n=1 Tax=Polaromonas sp. (strain JS666 / ATCC BAA-500) TaxID=296591 RepID=UPI0000532545|nr:XRE family transcriptional regulator [Polaromonas sp. JS666]ABE43865.1 transcriptional regulator, XRE family [Polaromonas sp. JS666]